jgi:hypothetical protein
MEIVLQLKLIHITINLIIDLLGKIEKVDLIFILMLIKLLILMKIIYIAIQQVGITEIWRFFPENMN